MTLPKNIAAMANDLLEERGWLCRNDGERRVADWLIEHGVKPSRHSTSRPVAAMTVTEFDHYVADKATGVECQFHLGRYRLDFAFVKARFVIEADGWVHTNRMRRQLDKRRDRELQEWGWWTYRVNVDASEEEFDRAMRCALNMLHHPPRENGDQ